MRVTWQLSGVGRSTSYGFPRGRGIKIVSGYQYSAESLEPLDQFVSWGVASRLSHSASLIEATVTASSRTGTRDLYDAWSAML
jgi:hypothetical protein